jgi:hypothetical protein
MSIEPLTARELAALVLGPDSGLAGRLALGQVIHGTVLRHYEGNRYLVRFLGRDHVVDSATPLKADEVVHGRVVRLDERIELERLDEHDSQAAFKAGAPASNEPWLAVSGGAAARLVEELFRRHRSSLGAEDAARLRRAVARAPRPQRMALAGLVLAKCGLPLEPDWLDSLYAVLDAPAGALAAMGERARWPAAQWVLNRQTGGTVSHQAGMLPLENGGALLAVDAALFEEQEKRKPADGIEHRKFVLTLTTERLGRVELRAVMADTHLRVALATQTSESTHALLRHGESLVRALAEAGWQVDEISHETRALGDGGSVAAAVAEHIVTPGSVSRLL